MGALGHHELAGVVGELAIGWDDVRTGMVKDAGFLGEACGCIGDTFAALDEVVDAVAQTLHRVPPHRVDEPVDVGRGTPQPARSDAPVSASTGPARPPGL